jgi:hypothetical protein
MRCLDASSFRLKVLAAILVAGCSVAANAQQQLPPIASRPVPTSPGQAPNPSDDNDQDAMARRAMIQQARRRNDQRQQDIVNDTAKLLVLTQQLKAELEKNKNNKDQMSATTIKKAEEIEKLAKSVKEKMKGS